LTFARRAAALAILFAFATVIAAAAPARPADPKPAAVLAQATPAPAQPRATPAPATPAANDDALDAIAALVNDEAVLASDVEEQLYLYVQRSNARPDPTQVDTLRRQILDQLIDEKLLIAEAKRQGMTVADAEIERQIDQAIGEAKERLGGEEAYREQLRRENTSEAQLREKYRGELRRQLMVRRLVERQFPRRPVPQNEAETYFTSHRDKFPKVPAEVRLSVIQVAPEPDSVALRAGRAKAAAARKRITGGEKFAKVAAEVSDDPASKDAGGDLGFFTRGRMERAFEDVAFTMPLNQLSQPVRSPYGWHLIEVLERDTLKTAKGRDSLDTDGKPQIEVHARHIVVRVTPTQADVERAKSLAERVRAEAVKGTNFATLVRRYSQYDGPVSPDGDVGFVSMATLQPMIRAGLDTLEVGQVSEVLPNQAGFNIFKVNDRHPEREYTLEEVKDDLPDAVAQVQFREKYEAWLKDLRTKAQIEYRSF
jgi:peptidyl-prolyl cis-trans isomerase SurA